MRFVHGLAIVGVLAALGCTEGLKFHPDGGTNPDAVDGGGTGGMMTGDRGTGGTGMSGAGAMIAGSSGGTAGTLGSGGMSSQGSGGGLGGASGGGPNPGSGGAATGGAPGTGGASVDGGSEPDGSSAPDRPMTCSAVEKICAGMCVSTTDPAYGCGASTCDSSTCPSPGAGGTVACQAGTCVIATCPTNFKKCGNKCVAVSDPAYGCGATTCDGTTCPAAGSGTVVCQGGSCVIGSCGAGTKKCGDKCVTTDANNGCSDTSRCTPCASNENCTGTPSTCQCVPTPMSTACSGKCNSVSNGCGGTYNCGGCVAPQTCGAVTANVCGCKPVSMAMACSGKTCGTASDGCGGSYTCGPCALPKVCSSSGSCGCPSSTPTSCGSACCGGATPQCLNGTSCVECVSNTDCAGKGNNCSGNKCVCHQQDSNNLLKNAGLDSDGSWVFRDGAQRVSSPDAEGCPGSGSLDETGPNNPYFFQCITDRFSQNKAYNFGYSFKGNGDGRCVVVCFGGSGCTGEILQEFDYGVTSSGNWATQAWTSDSVPFGTTSIGIDCTAGALGYYDELFFTQPPTAAHF